MSNDNADKAVDAAKARAARAVKAAANAATKAADANAASFDTADMAAMATRAAWTFLFMGRNNGGRSAPDSITQAEARAVDTAKTADRAANRAAIAIKNLN